MSVAQAVLRRIGRIKGPGLVASLARSAGSAFAIQAAGQALVFVSQLILARVMGRAEFGIFTWISSWVLTLGVLVALGLPPASMRFLPEYTAKEDWAHLRGVASRSQALVWIAGVSLAVIGACVLLLVRPPHYTMYFVPGLIGLCIVPLTGQSLLLTQMCRALRRVALAYAPSRILQPLLVLGVAFAFVHHRKVATGVHMLIAMAAAVAVAWFLQRLLFQRDLNNEAPAVAPAYDIKAWMAVAMPLLLVSVCQMTISQVDVLTVGAVLGPRDVAVYGMVNRFVGVIGFAMIATNAALGPEIATFHVKGDRASLQLAVSATVKMTSLCAAGMAIVLLCVAKPVLSLVGHGYAAGYAALCLLTLGALVNSSAGPVGLILNMTGHQKATLAVFSVGAVLDIALNYVLVHKYGYIGAAFASMTTMILWNVWLCALVKKYLQVDTFIGALLFKKPQRV